MKKLYRVRDKQTGKFWKGGSVPQRFKTRVGGHQNEDITKYLFSTEGKVYTKLQYVKSAVNTADKLTATFITYECEIVEYTITPTKTLDMKQVITKEYKIWV